MLVSYLRSTR